MKMPRHSPLVVKIIVMSPEARAEMGAYRCFMRDTFDEQLVIQQYLATLKNTVYNNTQLNKVF